MGGHHTSSRSQTFHRQLRKNCVSGGEMVNDKLMIAALILALGMPALAQSNEELLQERLITSTLYRHVNRNGADTPEERTLVIVEAGEANQAGPDVLIARANAIQPGDRTRPGIPQLSSSTAVRFYSCSLQKP